MSEYEPITTELRETIRSLAIDDSVLTIGGDDFHRLCDAIDAVHAALERENAELRQRVSELDKRGESMHDGGRITGELRAWWVRKFPVMDKELHKDFTAIAGRIDAAHERELEERADRYSELRAKMDDCYIELPKDADGVPIHIGDVLTDDAEFKSEGKVVRLMLEDEGWMVGFECGGWSTPSLHEWRHYHAPTVEDVLREFAEGLGVPVADSYIAASAAKLRLAGDAE